MEMNKKIAEYFDQPDQLFNWLHGAITWISVANLACQSGLAEAVAEGPVSVAALTERTGLPRDKLIRIIDYLCAHDLLACSNDGVVTSMPHTAKLAEPEYAGLWATRPTLIEAGTQLYPALKQGATPFEMRFGKPAFEYLEEHADLRANFRDLMKFMTRRELAFTQEHFAFEPFELAVDVGGNHGGFLMSVLEQHSNARGVLFDLPGVIAQVGPTIRSSPLSDRIDIVEGSFFETAPVGDLYLLKKILHDWDDDDCRRILSTIRSAIRPGGRIVVVDHVLSDEPEPTEGQATDITMMTWLAGRERKVSEFERLFAQTGFELSRIARNPVGTGIIEAAPV